MNFYNDCDEFCVKWMRNLIAVGHIPPGPVDGRSIAELSGCDIAGYRQCHFFVGIGGWPYALKLAGWPQDREVWTGSCPCQPFSSAGKRQGIADQRNLWPELLRLISKRRPATIFGEQVASKAGRHWFAGIRADLEALGYAVGAADLPAACVGAPHMRQRLFWVADAERDGGRADLPRRRSKGRIADFWSNSDRLVCLDWKTRRIEPGTFSLVDGLSARLGRLRGFGNAIVPHAAAQFVRAFV
jgi:DNA (cytosine-5)-methyltransferase 1